MTLNKVPGGTRLTLNHANVPDDQTSYEESGWKEHYFTPMQRYFMTMTNVAAVVERAKAEDEDVVAQDDSEERGEEVP